MNKFYNVFLKSFGLTLVAVSLFVLEHNLDTGVNSFYYLKPMLNIFAGFMIYFYNKD